MIRAAVLAAWLLALAVALGPAAAPGLPVPSAFAPVPVQAAGDELEVATEAVYQVDTDARRVRVTVRIAAANRKPVTRAAGVVTRYRYEAVNVAVPPEAVRVRATQDGATLDPDPSRRDGFKLITVPFLEPLYFGEQAAIELVFDLPAGKARSASGVRIGEAFLSFPVWAYGDRGSVKVVVPADYDVATRGEPLEASTSATGATVLTASTQDPLTWYAFVDATDDAALATRAIALPGGSQVLLRAWPEDVKWQRVASRVIAEGIPELQRRIGLPWPVTGTMTVSEVHTPLLEGYAGFYDAATARITIGEQLDRLTILHEASHAWLNGRLFTERWITEGLAEEYAARVLRAQGVDVPGPPKVKRRSSGAFPLSAWPPPAAIGDQAAVRRERFGYAASWTVIRKVVNATGEAGMRRVFAAAAAGTTAYPGAGTPEPATIPNDWRRLVDLAEELGGADDVASLVADWALPRDADPPLAARSEARTAYHALDLRAGAWSPPPAVRLALDAWSFATAQDAIEAAEAALAARDALAAESAALGLPMPAALGTAYASARSEADLVTLARRIEEAHAALPALVTAAAAAGEPRDWLADLGLGDEDPAATLAAARDAWAAGDVTTARTGAEALAARLAGATDAGTGRLAAMAALPAIAALLLAVVGLAVGLRRRRTP